MGKSKAYLAAAMVLLVWGSTNTSTKILLENFDPVSILVVRMLLGFFALCLISPHFIPWLGVRKELHFAATGFFGICLYYLLEVHALTMTYATNVGLIGASLPLLTAAVIGIVYRDWSVWHRYFVCSLLMAVTGIYLITFQNEELHLNPLGDFFAILSNLSWAIYMILVNKISEDGDSTILIARRTLLYGLLFLLPSTYFFDCHFDISEILQPIHLVNFVFLGMISIGVCFALWNYVIAQLGAVKSSMYGYLIPIINLVVAMLILEERLTLSTFLGMVLIMGGVLLSHKKMA